MNWSYVFSYLIMDATCFIISLIVIASIKGDSGSEFQVRSFRWTVLAYLGFLATDAIWATMRFALLIPASTLEVSIVNGANKITVVLAAYFWFCYGESCLGRDIVDSRAKRALAALPVVAVPILYVVGMFTGLTFDFQPDGSFVNGPMYAVITGAALLYLLAVTIDALREFIRAETSARRRLCATLMSFVAAPIISAVIDLFVPNIPIAAPCIMISIVLTLLFLQESRISSDVLTGLNNRRRADSYLEESLARMEADEPLCLFIIDMDGFKAINDTYGHLEGDRALQIMAEALRKSCADWNAFAARWGGDEFVMICSRGMGGAQTGPEEVAEGIKQRLADEVRARDVRYDLLCSIGYAKCETPKADAHAVIRDADRSLYEQKRIAHSRA